MAPGAESAEGVVEAIRRAGSDRDRLRETMNGLYAESVVIAHEPPRPSDGPVPAGVLIALADAEVAALGRAVSGEWSDPPEVSLEGDHVRVRNHMGGTLSDGTDIELATNTLYTISAGRIVGLRSEMSPDEMQRWGTVLAEGKFEVPAELRR